MTSEIRFTAQDRLDTIDLAAYGERLDKARAQFDEAEEQLRKEILRRDQLTPEQKLATKLYTMFGSRLDRDNAWYYEGVDDWNGSEHQRWLKKARKVQSVAEDANINIDEAIAIARVVGL
jgi:beta-xylosidase